MDFPKIDAYFILCRTGCTCCSRDNFLIGPFDQASALLRLAYLEDGHGIISSQYSKNGHYNIRLREIEVLPDGRGIIEDRVWGANQIKFKVPGPKGEPAEGEWFCLDLDF